MSNNKSKSNKGLKALAITLAAVIVAAAAYTGLSLGLNSWNPADWVNHTEEVQPEGQVSGGGAIIDETKSNGVRLASATIAVADYDEYGISPLAETAYTLTATVYDEDSSSDGIPQDVIYTAEWQNPSSEWATGKDIADYYTVTSTGVNTATATCLQAFGEPIVITATSYFNEDAYCTWEANYVKRVENIEFSSGILELDFTTSVNYEIIYGTGTVTGEVTLTDYRISRQNLGVFENNSYYKYFISQAEDAGVYADFNLSVQYDMNCTIDTEFDYVDYFQIEVEPMFLSNMSSEDVATLRNATNNYEYFIYALYNMAAQQTNDVFFRVNYIYEYNDIQYSSGAATTDWFELEGDYPQPANVTGNDVDLIY